MSIRHMTWLEWRRRGMGLTQRQLAKLVGIHSCAISKAERLNAKMRKDVEEAVGRVLGLRPDDLYVAVDMSDDVLMRQAIDNRRNQ